MLLYYLLLPFIYLISLLPFPVMYALSDFVYLIIYYVTGYRKKVVMQNLRNAFPEKTEQELTRICKDFFHYLCDLMLETLKMLTVSKKVINERCRFTPESKELFDRYAAENKSTILVIGHFGNWEWAGFPCDSELQQHMYALYHPIANKYFNSLMLRIRSRPGTGLIPMKTSYKEILSHRDELTITTFIADQTPQPHGAYWTTFLNQDTPVFRGTEVIAKKLNYPVIYGSIRRVKRGYYEMTAEVLSEHPANTAEGEISEMHTRRLEQDIKSLPATWLWSHKRWKHKRPA